MKANQIGYYFDDFVEGDVISHAATKTIFESDNNIFSLLTMNHHPVHTNIEYAKKSEHGRILVVGTLVFSITVGMSVNDISGKAIANLGYEDIRHLRPVFIGDTIRAETTILGVRPSKSKPDRGIIHVVTTAYNQNDEPVLSFERSVLIKRSDKESE